jgi:hypothetical protein
LKVYDTKVIQHVIPLKEDQRPFKLETETDKSPTTAAYKKRGKETLFEAKIIVSLWFSKWVANLVPVRKKSGEIRLCVDFQNLNKVSLKDHYPLPKMDYILQKVVGSQKMSMLDGFSGYNQIMVHPDDRDKMAFMNSMGNVHVCQDAFQPHECWSHFIEGNGHHVCRQKGQVHCDLSDMTSWYTLPPMKQHLEHLKKFF